MDHLSRCVCGVFGRVVHKRLIQGAYSGRYTARFAERTRNGNKVLHFRPLGLGKNYATKNTAKIRSQLNERSQELKDTS